MGQRTVILLISILVTVISFVSCRKKETRGDFGLLKNETLRMRMNGEPPSIDWHKSSDAESSLLTGNIMEGLVTFSYTSGEITAEPALASSWKSLQDGKIWEFTLREGVEWSDGESFEPKHLVDGWERLLNPLTASQYAYYLYSIKNAQKYNEGKIKDFSKVGLSVKGNVLRVELNRSMEFPMLLTHASTFPIRKDVVNKYGDQWTEPENIVTLGPYNLTKWEHDKVVVLQKNENYFGSPARTKNIIFYLIQEDQTALNLFDLGKIDVLRDLPPKDLIVLKKRKEYIEFPVLSIYYYGFNTQKPPTDNVWFRKAVSHAIDRNQIAKVLQGGQRPLSGWVPYGMFGYDASVGLAFDPVRAKEYLKKAGYDKDHPLPKIELSFNTLDSNKVVAENIQAQLKENLNLTVEIKNEEWKVYLSSLKSNPSHLYRMGWVADYPDPNNFFEILLSYSENNRTGWKNKKFDSLIEQAAGIVKDKKKRLQLYGKAHQILMNDEVPVFPIYTKVEQHLISNRVISFPTNVMSEYRLKNTSLQ